MDEIAENSQSEAAVEPKIKNKSRLSGNKCCLAHCRRSKRTHSKLKIFRFPYLNTLLLNVWLKNCCIDEHYLERSQPLYICERHFTRDCIGKKYLKNGAVPTLNLTSNDDSIVIARESHSINITFPKTPSCNPMALKPPQQPSVCVNCSRSRKNEEFYLKKYLSAYKKLQTVRKEKLALRLKNESLKKRITRLELKVKNTKSVEVQIDNLDISPNEKTFCKMLIKLKRGTKMRWNDQETNLAKSIFHKSVSTYRFLRNKLKLNLPHPSSLSRWNRSDTLQPDNNTSTNNNAITELTGSVNTAEVESKN